jgi:protease stability complex PrcB-like protein
MIVLIAAALAGQLTAPRREVTRIRHDLEGPCSYGENAAGAPSRRRDDEPRLAMTQASAAAPRTIEKGDQSNVDDARQALVRTDAEWTRLWQQHAPGRPMPKVDFSREMVLAVFMGSRPNAGFSTAVVSATAANGALMVRYSETKPPAGSVSAQILTFPYHLVAIPRADVKDVKFEKIP